MITIPNTNYKASDIQQAQILNSTTKVNMLTVLKKFDLYAMKGVKAPSAKELRMMSAMREFFGK